MQEHQDEDNSFCLVVDEMAKSVNSVREAVQDLLKNSDFNTGDGISLLSLKHQLLLSYLHSLTLLSAHRILGHSLTRRARPSLPFTAADRGTRGAAAGDLVDSLIENRVALEKIKQLESRMRYQIEKLVKIAEEDSAAAEVDIINDPLAFRPNPENLIDQERFESNSDLDEVDRGGGNAIYRPPKLAPVPYTEKRDKPRKHAHVPAGLAALAHLDSSNLESSSGLGGPPSLGSARARELARMNAFEEENMTRLVMTKKEARRRARDEADVALGGTGTSHGRSRGGGLADEFKDLLRPVDRKGRSGPKGVDDGYEVLRASGRKQDAWSRLKARKRENDGGVEGERARKKTRFQSAVRSMAKRHKSK